LTLETHTRVLPKTIIVDLFVQNLSEVWFKIPEKLTFYDYIGNNPVKGVI